MKKRVTVLIATYKSSEEFVQSKVESLLSQTALGLANIVILNCEDKGGESRKFSAFCRGQSSRWHNPDRDPPPANVIEVTYHDYVKLYKSWNDGIRITDSDYIVNYNIDDQWHPGFLEKCIGFLDGNPQYAMVSTRIATTSVPHQVWSHYGKWHADGELPFLPYPESTAGPCPMWRRSLHDKYGYFDDYFVIGDARLWERCLAGSERFGLLDEPLTLYYRNPESLERRQNIDGVKLRDIDLASS